MTRKDYIEIARILRTLKEDLRNQTHPKVPFDAAIAQFCAHFKRDNPNFSSDKFKEAVYLFGK